MSEHQDDEMKTDQVGHEPHGGRSDLEPAASPQLPHVAPNSRAEVWAAIRAFAGACEQRARTPFLYFADAINGGDEREQCEARIERALDVFARSIQVGCATDSAQEQAVALPSEAQKNTTCNLDISQTTETVEQAKRNVDNPQDVLTRLHERIESKLVPSLNAGGTAFDMLVIVAEATRELRSELALGPAVRAEAEHRAEHLEAENARLKAPAVLCYVCGKPAACIANYEAEDHYQPACDEHCGHGNEDGWCRPVPEAIAEMSKWLLQANTSEIRRIWDCRVCGFGVAEGAALTWIRDHGEHYNAVSEWVPNKGTAYCPKCSDETLRSPL